jgi:type 1 glutamine amidotransferase
MEARKNLVPKVWRKMARSRIAIRAKQFLALWTLALVWTGIAAAHAQTAKPQPRILVYTRNYTPDGKGYVHDNIAASVEAIQKMGAESGFTVDPSDDSAVFTAANLQQYAAVVFSNSNNQAFSSEAQRSAFQHYIQAGGGFVGLHSASGSERDWPWFWSMLGGKFARHPKMQSFTVTVADPRFPAVANLPAQFVWTDECYFIDHLNPGIHPVLVTDRTKLSDLDQMNIDVAGFPNPLPLAWYQQFDGGREFYLALGHNKQDYSNPLLYGIIRGAILWAMNPKP